MKVLLMIFGGLADRPAPELAGKTPLEAACTPNMDRLAKNGITGLFHPLKPGYAVGSPLAVHLMFGYAEELYPNRGPLLAVGRGLQFRDAKVALAARLSSVALEGGKIRLVQRFIRNEEEDCRQLAMAVSRWSADDISFRYEYVGHGDGTLFLTGPASHEITDVDPLGMDLPVLKAEAKDHAQDAVAAVRTAKALNGYLSWVHQQLMEHPMSEQRHEAGKIPINFVITKWAGRRQTLEPFTRRWGMRPASVPGEEAVAGLVSEMGFSVMNLDEEEDTEQDLLRRLGLAKDLFESGFELVHLHTRHPVAGSDANSPEAVLEAIEALDRGLGLYWQDLGADPDLVTVLTADHTTPSVWTHHPRRKFLDLHGGEPVPLAIVGGNVRIDEVDRFGERACAVGGLGHLCGDAFMPVVLNAAELVHVHEMWPFRRPYLYRPREGDVEPFVVSG